MEIERQNPQWADGFAYPYERKRFLFGRLMESFKGGLITAVYGLRRVGKSVILKQMMNDCIKGGIERKNTFYFSFDEERADFWGAIKEYEKFLGRRAGRKNCIFLDEVQKVPDWRGKLKVLYDASGAKITVSGSNSAKIRKGGESLAGRINEFYLPELKFREFLYFKGKEALFESGLSEALELEFGNFLLRPFPETALNEGISPAEYAKTIARKIIYEDLPSAFPIDEPELLSTIFLLICKNPGMQIEYERLASDLGRDRKTISAYLQYLSYGFLVRKIYNFSRNALSSERKLKRFYPSLSVFCECEQAKAVETAVAQALDARFFWREKDRYEVDFVLELSLSAFEVKYQEGISPSDWLGLKKFAEKFKGARTVMVSKKAEEKTIPYYAVEGYLEKKGAIR